MQNRIESKANKSKISQRSLLSSNFFHPIKHTHLQMELACTPQVSPTSSYQEIIQVPSFTLFDHVTLFSKTQGKNMSLVCTVTSTPMASISWRYKGLLINNGSTMVSDIDMRLYYYKNIDLGEGSVKSELILLRTNLDDNGTFQCVAENRAGQAVANFSLNVVVPFPPKPPQDVVEEGFQQEYIVAIGIAGVIVSILTTVIVILVAVKCHGLKKRRQSLAESKVHLYQNSACGSDLGSRESSLRGETPVLQGALLNPHQAWPIHPDAISLMDSRLAAPDILSHHAYSSPEKDAAASRNEGRSHYRELPPDPRLDLEVVKVRVSSGNSFI